MSVGKPSLFWLCVHIGVVVVVSFFFTNSLFSANITVSKISRDEAAIFIVGNLLSNDGEEFDKAISSYTKGIVVFNSDGGNLLSGLHIGTTIRLRNWSTVVMSGGHCASACALAWLGGTRRFMEENSEIGFHAAYIIDNGKASETGAGNALVGAYLNRLGLSDRAILYATTAAPNEMAWLSMEDARALGITVLSITSEAHTSPTALPSTPLKTISPPSLPSPAPTFQSEPAISDALEQAAARFVKDYFTKWSETNSIALPFAGSVYRQNVEYYGKSTSLETIMREKRIFAERWPERKYLFRLGTVVIKCGHTGGFDTCEVSGTVDWECGSASRRAIVTGSTDFRLGILFENGRPFIVSENGSVTRRP